MKKIFLYVLISIMAFGTMSYAQVAFKRSGTQYGVAAALNTVAASGVNWAFDGFNLTDQGVNWVAAHVLDTSYGGHSGINWQSFGA